MPLRSGEKLGVYEIVELLGVGGMGEVYRARDTVLKRDVAIKALPEAFSRDTDRLLRFQREAEVLASLSHPNIAAIHHLEEVAGSRFLILELVEGETLAERISRGPLPVPHTMEIALQIANAVEAAHAKGIVHRDLKPANVKVTEENKVKVLDFGLAKVFDAAPSSASQSPTLVSGTMSGALLGTAGYMSPEQARGQNADRQSDVWAFGCILYEMLTGKSSFPGQTTADILGSIVRGEPNWNALPKDTPARIVLLLKRCLQKDRTRRLRDIGDAALELSPAAEDVQPLAAAALPARSAKFAWLIAAASVILALLLGIGVWNRAVPESQTLRFTIPPPQRFFIRGQAAHLAVSPDGRHVAFVAEDDTRRIWLRSLDSTEVRSLAGTDNAVYPFWSADSRYLGYWRNQRLHRLSIADGQSQPIVGASGFPLATWSRNGAIVFSADGVLHRVSAGGTEATEFLKPDASRKETGLSTPDFLPDGNHLVFSVAASDSESRGVWLISMESGERKRLLPFTARTVYSPATGDLIYLRGGRLFAHPFDAERLEFTGEAANIHAETADSREVGTFDVSDTGILAWNLRPAGAANLVWRDRTGKKTNAAVDPGLFRQVRLSPDGTRAAINVAADNVAQDIWLLEISSGAFSRITSAEGNENDSVWSPDGRQIAYQWNGNLYRRTVGSPAVTPLLESGASKWLHDWSPDGKTIVFAYDRGIYTIASSGQGQESVYLENDFNKDEFRVSPDGRWIAYNSDENGRSEVYIASFPKFDNRRQISNSGGAIPRWRGDMREMYYLRLDGMMMAVDLRGTNFLEAGTPRTLFQTDVPVSTVLDQYDVTADGQKFLIIENEENAVSPPIHVEVNWAAQKLR